MAVKCLTSSQIRLRLDAKSAVFRKFLFVSGILLSANGVAEKLNSAEENALKYRLNLVSKQDIYNATLPSLLNERLREIIETKRGLDRRNAIRDLGQEIEQWKTDVLAQERGIGKAFPRLESFDRGSIGTQLRMEALAERNSLHHLDHPQAGPGWEDLGLDILRELPSVVGSSGVSGKAPGASKLLVPVLKAGVKNGIELYQTSRDRSEGAEAYARYENAVLGGRAQSIQGLIQLINENPDERNTILYLTARALGMKDGVALTDSLRQAARQKQNEVIRFQEQNRERLRQGDVNAQLASQNLEIQAQLLSEAAAGNVTTDAMEKAKSHATELLRRDKEDYDFGSSDPTYYLDYRKQTRQQSRKLRALDRMAWQEGAELIGFIGQLSGKQEVAALGSTIEKVLNYQAALDSLQEKDDALNGLGKGAASLAEAGFSLNLGLGLITTFMSLMNDAPDFKEILFEQLKDIKSQLRDIQNEMREHFKALDRNLTTRFERVMNVLDEINETTEYNRVQLDFVMRRLGEIERESQVLGQYQVDLLKQIDDDLVRDGVRTCNAWSKANQNDISSAEFDKCMVHYYKCMHAAGRLPAVGARPSTVGYSNLIQKWPVERPELATLDALFEATTKESLGSTLPRDFGVDGPVKNKGSTVLINPEMWNYCAESFLSFVDRYPKLFSERANYNIFESANLGSDYLLLGGKIFEQGKRLRGEQNSFLKQALVNHTTQGLNFFSAIDDFKKDEADTGVDLSGKAAEILKWSPSQWKERAKHLLAEYPPVARLTELKGSGNMVLRLCSPKQYDAAGKLIEKKPEEKSESEKFELPLTEDFYRQLVAEYPEYALAERLGLGRIEVCFSDIRFTDSMQGDRIPPSGKGKVPESVQGTNANRSDQNGRADIDDANKEDYSQLYWLAHAFMKGKAFVSVKANFIDRDREEHPIFHRVVKSTTEDIYGIRRGSVTYPAYPGAPNTKPPTTRILTPTHPPLVPENGVVWGGNENLIHENGGETLVDGEHRMFKSSPGFRQFEVVNQRWATEMRDQIFRPESVASWDRDPKVKVDRESANVLFPLPYHVGDKALAEESTRRQAFVARFLKPHLAIEQRELKRQLHQEMMAPDERPLEVKPKLRNPVHQERIFKAKRDFERSGKVLNELFSFAYPTATESDINLQLLLKSQVGIASAAENSQQKLAEITGSHRPVFISPTAWAALESVLEQARRATNQKTPSLRTRFPSEVKRLAEAFDYYQLREGLLALSSGVPTPVQLAALESLISRAKVETGFLADEVRNLLAMQEMQGAKAQFPKIPGVPESEFHQMLSKLKAIQMKDTFEIMLSPREALLMQVLALHWQLDLRLPALYPHDAPPDTSRLARSLYLLHFAKPGLGTNAELNSSTTPRHRSTH